MSLIFSPLNKSITGYTVRVYDVGQYSPEHWLYYKMPMSIFFVYTDWKKKSQERAISVW